MTAIEHPTSALLMAYRTTALIGTAMVAWDGWRGTVYRIVVSVASRREGVATEMVREAERRLNAEGCRRISILVLRDEAPAHAFWRAAGYRRDDRIDRFFKPLDPPGR